jgi:hypothetical protein
MGSRPSWSTSFGAWALAAFALHAAISPSTARAQHADAGVQRQARAPAVVEPKPPAEVSAGGASGELPKAIDPALLSDGTRAGLAERAAGRHPGSLPSPRPDVREPGALSDSTVAGARFAPSRSRAMGEPVRRGEAHMRRVQALETDEGITLLSNRINALSGSPRLASIIAEQPPPRPLPDAPPAEEEAVVRAEPGVTETHSLKPLSSRRLEAKSKGSGLGWLLWPFVLFVTSGAVVGTLWFRKKTD